MSDRCVWNPPNGRPLIRVLVVDPSAIGRRTVSTVLSGDPEIDVVGMASDGKGALSELQRLDPDAVVLALDLPVMDGLETVVELRRRRWTQPVIVVSAASEGASEETFQALLHGATDFVTRPSTTQRLAGALDAFSAQLLPKIKALCRPPEPEMAVPAPHPGGAPKIVVVGASTGGPQALAEILPAISAFLPAPILIAQHMPSQFTAALARSLDKRARLSVREAYEGAVPKPGEAWIARGNYDLELMRRRGPVHLTLRQGPTEGECRPCADLLFRSAVSVYGGEVLGVVLSGVGLDGVEGARAIREAGGEVVVQDEGSSIAWRTPGAVVEAGVADGVLPASEIASVIWDRLGAPEKPRAKTGEEGRDS